jgi:hypothetical protein
MMFHASAQGLGTKVLVQKGTTRCRALARSRPDQTAM